jgi:hypothetical protein
MKSQAHWGAIKTGTQKRNKDFCIHSCIDVERIDSRIFTKRLYKESLTVKRTKYKTEGQEQKEA